MPTAARQRRSPRLNEPDCRRQRRRLLHLQFALPIAALYPSRPWVRVSFCPSCQLRNCEWARFRDDNLCTVWATIRADARAAGRALSPQDAWIAATALALDARAEAERAQVPATTLAREAIDSYLRQQRRRARHQAIAAYAVRMAGTNLDLDPELESAGIEHLVKAAKRLQ